VGVAPVDVVEDQAGLGVVVGVVCAVEAEVAEPLELRFDPVEPGGVAGARRARRARPRRRRIEAEEPTSTDVAKTPNLLSLQTTPATAA
jgi:hypothetical protein